MAITWLRMEKTEKVSLMKYPRFANTCHTLARNAASVVRENNLEQWMGEQNKPSYTKAKSEYRTPYQMSGTFYDCEHAGA
jgi:hypothetical protein